MTKRRGPRPALAGVREPMVVLDEAARCKNKGGKVAPNGDCRRCGAANAETCR